jgi:hypothetical protein
MDLDAVWYTMQPVVWFSARLDIEFRAVHGAGHAHEFSGRHVGGDLRCR